MQGAKALVVTPKALVLIIYPTGLIPKSASWRVSTGRSERAVAPVTIAVFLLGLLLIVLASAWVAAPLFRAGPAALPADEPDERERWARQKQQALAAIKEMMAEEFKILPPQDYARLYELEHHRRATDPDEIFARIAYNKNVEALGKLRKKPLEDLYVAYLEIKDSGYRGPAGEVEPKLPD